MDENQGDKPKRKARYPKKPRIDPKDPNRAKQSWETFRVRGRKSDPAMDARAFARALVAHRGNAALACKSLGFKSRTFGHQMANRPDVIAMVEEMQRQADERAVLELTITRERWLKELAIIAFADMDHYATVTAGNVVLRNSLDRPIGASKAISSISQTVNSQGGKQEIKLHAKIPALEVIGKALGYYTEVVEHSGPDGKPVQVQMLTADDWARMLEERRRVHGDEPSGAN